MKGSTQTKRRRAPSQSPANGFQVIHFEARFDQRADLAAMGYKPGDDIAKAWFKMKFYDDLSDLRPEKSSYYKHYVYEFVSEYFSFEKIASKTILDFGCGPGFYSAILAQRGGLVTGIDLSPFLIDKAKEHKARLGLNHVEFIQADFVNYSSRLPSNHFDYVIAIDTLVSFDYSRNSHDHERASRAFHSIAKVMKPDGRCLVIESHPFFGRVLQEVVSDTGEFLCVRSPHYKIEYRLKSDVHHWFTLDEMTRATSENGLAILRIYEPDPSLALQQENPLGYSFRLKYPGLIVYEICKLGAS